MGYEVIARKWRPQQFADVVGQQHVVQTLKNAIASQRVAHAYLFVGPRGIGKTTLARIFAKALNCEKGPTATPCDACDACREITAGNSLDVLEIDGASNNGVEQVRELRETAQYAPAHARFKIIYIDEVHMLSAGAFNALLKTLEEPPAHVKFLFATTEAHKLPPTIVSRCQRFDLRRIPVALIVERLKLIAKDEKVKVDDDALAIARGSEGGLRDAESALDQLIAFKGAKIAEEDVLSVFGLVSRATLSDLARAVLTGDVAALVRVVAELDNAGKDMQRLVIELMDHFRNLLVCVSVKEGHAGLDLTESQVQDLRAQSELADTARLLRITDVLADAEERMKYTLSKRVLLETALIRCARAAKTATLEEVLAQVNELRRQIAAGGGGAVASRVQEAAAPAYAPAAAARAPAAPSAAAPRQAAAPAPAAADGLELVRKHWGQIVDKAGKLALPVKSVLQGLRPESLGHDTLVLVPDVEFMGDVKVLDSTRGRMAVQSAVKDVLGRTVNVTIREKPAPAETPVQDDAPAEDAPAAASSAAATLPAAPAAGGGARKRRSTREWADEPAVRKVMETFSGAIVDVKE